MKNIFKLIGIITVMAVIGFAMAACGGGGEGDVGWNNGFPSALQGEWRYNGQLLFAISADGSGYGWVDGEGGYTVQTRNIELYNGEVRFLQSNTEIGQFSYSLNGDGDMWIKSGTGPFAKWVDLGSDPSQDRYWMLTRR